MNYMLLVNVLEYFDRENLEKLSIVSRQFKKIVRTEFPQHPFRVFEKLRIVTDRNGDIRLGMDNNGIKLGITSGPAPKANVAQFKGLIESNDWFYGDMKHFPLRTMLPFMGKSVRFERTIIKLNSTLINQQNITAMENFAHLWAGQTLKIKRCYDHEDGSDSDSYFTCYYPQVTISRCDPIFNAPGVITPCRELQICGIEAPLSVYPALYGLKVILIKDVYTISTDDLLSFVEGLSKYNSTTILICFSSVDFKKSHIEKIRKAFSEAKVARAWKFIIVDEDEYGNRNLIEFRDENLLTKEVLELRLADYKTQEDFCNSLRIYCRDLWILERKSL
ncbi:hypothetical protein Ddc_20925 [Ditylenchus destructor]|nr:hypothetical protein Ddc_20925 [Ditylenchus destructor]